MTTVIKNPFTANVATSVTDMSDYINELYDRQLAARRAALAAAYDSKVAVQEAEESALDPAYREAKNRIASAAATEQRNFDEYANAAGLGSGAAAQGRLSRSVALQHDLNALETSRAQAHADFSAERSGLAAEYAEAVAEAEAEGNAERARALYQEGVRVQEAKDEATRYNNDLAYKLMTALASAAASGSKSSGSSGGGSASSSGGSARTASSSSSSAGTANASGLTGLFEEMEKSGAPYTYLVTNAAGYGLKNASTATLGEVYDEYKLWAEKHAVTSGTYTARELQNYEEVLSRLAVSSAEQGSDPVAYIDRLRGIAGDDYYTDLMGETLYNRLREKVPAYSAAYAEMRAAADPSKWLSQNSSRLSSELTAWLRSRL